MQEPPIIHCDLKPDNILLGYNGLFKLCDFGSCMTGVKVRTYARTHRTGENAARRCVTQWMSAVTSLNQPLDTKSEWRAKQVYETEKELSIAEEHFSRYTSASIRPPEMWDLYRREEIGPAVDCWGLGCILYALTSGRMPFTDEDKLGILNCSYTVSRHGCWMGMRCAVSLARMDSVSNLEERYSTGLKIYAFAHSSKADSGSCAAVEKAWVSHLETPPGKASR